MLKKSFYIVLTLILLFSIWFYGCYSKKVIASLDDYIYALPFAKGKGYKIVQGYGGWFSHNGLAALDFAMPVGTPIHAARDGEIFSYKETSNEGGMWNKFKDKANYLMIKHNDGTIGCYWHLQQNGVVVKNGKIAKGQLIAYSGNTGQCVQPHLHFSVKKKLTYDPSSFLKTKFQTNVGIEYLEKGKIYQH